MSVLIGEKQCAFTVLGFIESQNGRHGFSSLIMQEVERKLKMNISLGPVKERVQGIPETNEIAVALRKKQRITVIGTGNIRAERVLEYFNAAVGTLGKILKKLMETIIH